MIFASLAVSLLILISAVAFAVIESNRRKNRQLRPQPIRLQDREQLRRLQDDMRRR